MIKKTSTIAIVALAMLSASCSNDNENGSTETAKYITINTSIGAINRTTTVGNTQVFTQEMLSACMLGQEVRHLLTHQTLL